MIIKSFEIKDKKNSNYFLFYGENQGYKTQVIKDEFESKNKESIYRYEENEILNNKEIFFSNLFTKSFFENEKLIIINRATDKIRELIEEIIEKNIDGVIVILNSNSLEKKSKLRSLFEKSKIAICVPFYEDNNQTLSAITTQFFRNNKILISQQIINLIVSRCRGDRQNLNNELEKIKNYSQNRNKVEIQDIMKLTNLAENFSVSELVDSCLSKNKRKTINVLNENNYSPDDCVLIIRTFLIKTKRLVRLCKEQVRIKNLDETIITFKPPIFWKDKETIKQQIRSWSYSQAEALTYEINEIELLIKKYPHNSFNILSNFIINKTHSISN
jgi:DNA polymerase III subunit delta